MKIGGDSIFLGHDQSVTIMGLDPDTSYEIIEEDYSQYNYITTATNDKGIVPVPMSIIMLDILSLES